jgi:hypothetical protein
MHWVVERHRHRILRPHPQELLDHRYLVHSLRDIAGLLDLKNRSVSESQTSFDRAKLRLGLLSWNVNFGLHDC